MRPIHAIGFLLLYVLILQIIIIDVKMRSSERILSIA